MWNWWKCMCKCQRRGWNAKTNLIMFSFAIWTKLFMRTNSYLVVVSNKWYFSHCVCVCTKSLNQVIPRTFQRCATDWFILHHMDQLITHHECLGWWMSEFCNGVMNVLGDESLRWWKSQVMKVLSDERPILGMGDESPRWWMSHFTLWAMNVSGDECQIIN